MRVSSRFSSGGWLRFLSCRNPGCRYWPEPIWDSRMYSPLTWSRNLNFLFRRVFHPFRALQTATINPARFLHIDWKLGSVNPGKTADLVLVEANPLEDIRNLHLVRAVVLNGRFLDRGQLDGAVPRFQ